MELMDYGLAICLRRAERDLMALRDYYGLLASVKECGIYDSVMKLYSLNVPYALSVILCFLVSLILYNVELCCKFTSSFAVLQS